MADLSLNFQNLYEEVQKYLGTYNSGSPTATALADSKFIVNRAYARYTSYYDWTFLSQRKVLKTKDGEYIYELPSEFSYFIKPRFEFDGNDGYPFVESRSPSQIIKMRSETVYENYPMYFALQAGSYYKETGQGWNVMFYPTCDAVYNLTYFCKINPLKLVETTDIPIGGAEFSDCLLELCLAYAEAYKDEKKAIHAAQVGEILAPAKAIDVRRRTAHLGNMGISDGFVDVNDVHKGNVLVST